jgi:hypothetical protein
VVAHAPPVIYRISAADIIEDVNDAWKQFAIENDAPALATEVIGRSLWDYIQGLDVVHIYRDLLARVRAKAISATFPFRCDSPERYRRMRLMVVPLNDGRIEFRAMLDAAGLHAELMDLLRPREGDDPGVLVRMCAWCKAIEVDERWMPLEEAIKKMRLFLRGSFPRLTHGICDACAIQYAELAP